MGAGRVAKWDVRRLKMNDLGDVAAWLRQDLEKVPKEEDLGVEAPAGFRRETDRSFCIEANLKLVTSLLVRSGGEIAGGPDMTHLSEQGRKLLPGTSLAGALRGRCGMIARTLHDDDTCKTMIDSMFGPHGDSDNVDNVLHASRVSTSESVLNNGECLVQGRVAIDRFTGGALESRLFDEAAFWPRGASTNHLHVSIKLEEPQDDESGLMLLAFKDLWLGDLTLGGEAGIGRGVFHGVDARVTDCGREILTLNSTGPEPSRITHGDQDPKLVEKLICALVSKNKAIP
jgi:CRISPR/Cas system CSM-associated protein Csm3 (group 7 of RAMP superfamily)